jgi:magnesium transporter
VSRRRGARRIRAPLAPSARKVGLEPGALLYTGIERDHEVKAHVTVFDAEGFDERLDAPLSVALAAVQATAAQPPGRVTWVDVGGVHDLDALRALGSAIGLHSLTLEDLAHVGQRPKAEPFEGYLYVAARALSVAPAVAGVAPALRDEQVSVVVRGALIVTFQERPSDRFEPVRERVRRGVGRLRSGGAGYLLYALLDGVVDQGFVALEALSSELERLEDQVLDAATPKVLEQLVGLTRELAHLRRVAAPTRELLATLRRDPPVELDASVLIHLRDVYDHAVQVLEATDVLREIAGGLQATYAASVAHRTHEVVRVLAVWVGVFLPLLFIVGVYGMNFWNMPEVGWRWGYPAVWAAMILVAAGTLLWMRRRRLF